MRLIHDKDASAVARTSQWSGFDVPPRRTFLVGRRTSRRTRRAAGKVLVKVEVDQKITKKLSMKIFSATPKANVLQETSCTSLQDRRSMLFVTLIQLSPHFNRFYAVTAAANN